MLQEQERTIGNPWRARAEATAKALAFSFLEDRVLILLPIDSEWGIAQHVIKFHASGFIIGQRVTKVDAFLLLTFDHDV